MDHEPAMSGGEPSRKRTRAQMDHQQSQAMASSGPSDRIRLNIGGRLFSTTRTTLESEGESMLATLVSDNWNKEEPDQELFIDRDGRHFHLVLNFLRNGDQVVLPSDPLLLKELAVEADFYQLPQLRQLCLIYPLIKLVDFKVGDCVRIRPEAIKDLCPSLGVIFPGVPCRGNCERITKNEYITEKLLGSVCLSAHHFQFSVKCLGCLEKRLSDVWRTSQLGLASSVLGSQESLLAELQCCARTVVHVYDKCLALASGPKHHLHISKSLVVPELE